MKTSRLVSLTLVVHGCSRLLFSTDETLIDLVKTTPDGRCLDELQSSQKNRPLFDVYAFVDAVR